MRAGRVGIVYKFVGFADTRRKPNRINVLQSATLPSMHKRKRDGSCLPPRLGLSFVISG